MWGWVRGFKGDQGWNGCLTLPRTLTIDQQGKLQQQAAPELRSLRGDKILEMKGLLLEQTKKVVSKTQQLEIEATFAPGNDCGIRLFKTESNPGLEIKYANAELKVGDQKAPLVLHAVDFLNLHIFVDHSVVEVYGKDGVCLTKVFYPTSSECEIEFFSGNEKQILNGEVHELKGIW